MVCATQEHTGKTSVSMALIAGLVRRFGPGRVSYMKPVGQKHVQVEGAGGECLKVDKDVAVAKEHFGLSAPYSAMSPLVLYQGYTRRFLDGEIDGRHQEKLIREGFEELIQDHDFVVVEGTGHIGVGSIVGMNNADVAKLLGLEVLLVGNGGLGSTYDVLALNRTLCRAMGVRVRAVLLNKVQKGKEGMVRNYIGKALQRDSWDAPILGVVPWADNLDQPSTMDLELLFNTTALAGRQHLLRRYSRFELVTTSLRQLLEKLGDGGVNHTSTCFVTHATRNDIILGLLSHSQDTLDEKNGGATSFDAGIILTGTPPGHIPHSFVRDYISRAAIPVLTVGMSTSQVVRKGWCGSLHLNKAALLSSGRKMWLGCWSLRLVVVVVVLRAVDATSPGHNDNDRANARSFGSESVASSFLELATQRFEARHARLPTLEEENWAFDELQLVRVPKAGSSEASVIARRLGGCVPRGPCCRFPGDPVGSCPAEGLMCPAVNGCTSHYMGLKALDTLKDPAVFSMTNLRGVVDRLVSGFFYTKPHSPSCAHADNVDYENCFTEMVDDSNYQNIAARMLTGHYAYEGSAELCLDKQQAREADGGDYCAADLGDVIQGACNVNFVTMCETWESSVLLLFETLPWLGPTAAFFPMPKPEHQTVREAIVVAGGDPAGDGSRHNTGAKHEEGVKHITPALREAASRANSVDEALHEFVSAKFCQRLRDTGLLDHPLVAEELATFKILDQRCNDATWVSDTMDEYKPFMPEDCRLYRPMEKPE
eukprot:g7901.t1